MRGDSIMDPYRLGDKALSQLKFSDMLKEIADDGKVKFCFALGSGSHQKSSHIGYITDALFLPEVTTALKELAKVNNIIADIKSYLDIDIISDDDIRQGYNIISIGSGRVNLLSLELFAFFGDSLKICFASPGSAEIISNVRDKPKSYVSTSVQGEDCGILLLTCNPWAIMAGKKRVTMILAGNLPLGSVAAMYALLHDLLCYGEAEYKERQLAVLFGNRHDKSILAKVVKGTHNEYPTKFQCNPHTTSFVGNLNLGEKSPIEFWE